MGYDKSMGEKYEGQKNAPAMSSAMVRALQPVTGIFETQRAWSSRAATKKEEDRKMGQKNEPAGPQPKLNELGATDGHR